MTLNASHLDRPWMGLFPYSEEQVPLFFGRKDESQALSRLLERDTLSVLFAGSGLGKTSLLQAGLFPLLRGTRALPIYVRLIHGERAPGLAQQVIDAVLAAVSHTDGEIDGPRRWANSEADDRELWSFFHRRTNRFWDRLQRPVTPVLVLDQFEEIFTLGRASATLETASAAFLKTLSDLVENRAPFQWRRRTDTGRTRQPPDVGFDFGAVPIRVLVSLREDYLGHLEELRSLLPTIRQNRMRLTGLTAAQALEVVEGPGKVLPRFRVLEPGAGQAVIDVVSAKGRSRNDGSLDHERPVEPAFLSLFCDELYRHRQGAPITAELVHQQQREILGGYYDEVLLVLPEKDRLIARTFIEDHLLTQTGHRDSRDVEDAVARHLIQRGTLDALVARRLLRYEVRPGGATRVELSHDVLLEPVGQNRRQREQRQREQEITDRARAEGERATAAERDRERAYRMARQVRRRLALTTAGLVLALASVAGCILALSRARAEKRRADRATLQTYRAVADADLSTAGFLSDRTIGRLGAALRSVPDQAASTLLLHALLDDRISQVVSRLQVQGEEVGSAEFTHDGHSTLLVAGTKVLLWDIGTDAPRATLEHAHRLSGAVFSPDGRWILSWTPRGIWIWQTSAMKRFTLRDATDTPPRDDQAWVKAVSFNGRGDRVLATMSKGPPLLWHLTTDWKAAESLLLGDVSAATFSPDGDVLATAGDYHIAFWDLTRSPAPPPLRVPHGHILVGLEAHPDGRQLVARLAPEEEGAIMTFEAPWASSGKKALASSLRPSHGRFIGSMGGSARMFKMNPDGRGKVILGDGQVHLELAGQPRLGLLPHHPAAVREADFSPDGRRLLTIASDQALRIWNAETGRQLCEPMRHAGRITSATFGPDGRLVLSTSVDGWVSVWRACTGARIPTTFQHAAAVNGAAFGQGRQLVTWAGSKVFVWQTVTAKRPLVLDHTSSVTSAAFDARGERLVSTSEMGEVVVWRVADGKRLSTDSLGHERLVESAEFSPAGNLLVTASWDRTARIWDAGAAYRPVAELVHGGAVTAARFSSQGDRLLTTSRDKQTRIWDVGSGKPVANYRTDANVSHAEFSSDAQRVVIATDDRLAHIWAAPWKVPPHLLEHTDTVRTAAFSPDGTRLATASQDGTARIWAASDGSALSLPLEHGSPVASVRFAPHGKWLLTTDEDGRARLWDATAGQRISSALTAGTAPLRGGVVRPDSQVLLTIQDSRVHIWDLNLSNGATTGDGSGTGLPNWFPDWAIRFAGWRIDAGNELLLSRSPPPEIPGSSESPLTRLASWLTATGLDRTVAPFSGYRRGDFVNDRIAEDTDHSLAQAYDVLPGDPLVLAALALHLATAGENSDRARFYATHASRYAHVYSEDESGRTIRPRQAKVHYTVARAWHASGRLDDARRAVDEALRLHPSVPEYLRLKQMLTAI